jgi:hypothetical protein
MHQHSLATAPPPPQLNNQIRDADGREALLGLVESKGGLFDATNVATCLNRSVGAIVGPFV